MHLLFLRFFWHPNSNSLCIHLLGCHNKIPHTQGGKQQTFIVSQLQCLKVQKLTIHVFRWLPSPCVLTWSFLCVSSCVHIYLSFKDTDRIGLGPTYLTTFSLHYLCKGSRSNIVTFWSTGWGVKTSKWIWGGLNSAHITPIAWTLSPFMEIFEPSCTHCRWDMSIFLTPSWVSDFHQIHAVWDPLVPYCYPILYV